jgi:hypothetical protein
MSKDYNSGLDTAARIVEELIGGTSEGETILCGIESSKKDYECFQNQWDIMHNALRDIASNYNLDDGNILRQHLAQLAHDALNAVDKEWDKLYSKESND